MQLIRWGRTLWCVLTSSCTVRVHAVVQNCLVKIIFDSSFYSLLFHNRGRIHVLWGLKFKKFWGSSFRKEHNVTNTKLGTKMNMHSGPLPGSWKGPVQVRSFTVNPPSFVLIYFVHHHKIWLYCMFYCFFFQRACFNWNLWEMNRKLWYWDFKNVGETCRGRC